MYIGIDLGTSGVKLLIVNKFGKVIKSHTETYPIYYSNDNWSEQNPKDWWNATIKGLHVILEDFDKTKVKGISFGGQMHGLVMLDKNNEVIRPAILWNDGRCDVETSWLNEIVGKEKLIDCTGNIAFAGFTAPKILWVKKHEKENFDKIHKILLPKDYLAFKFSGIYSTDYSDASGTLYLNVKDKCWSKEMCDLIGIKEEQLPHLYESYEVVGNITSQLAEELGLSQDVKIIAGAGDNAAAAVGTGAVKPNTCNVSIGTSGTVFIPMDDYVCDYDVPIHSFVHSTGKFHLMGCILSASLCNKWWVEDVLGSNHSKEQENTEELLGKNNVLFLPYLMGERCPHNDTNARGAFIGLRANTTRQELTIAVLEGISFALKECIEIAEAKGVHISKTTLCGGGAKSKVWTKILANVFNKPIDFVETEQGPGFGAAILAMVGCGEYETVEQACKSIVRVRDEVTPNEEIAKLYQVKFETYKKIYKQLKPIYDSYN